MSFEYDDKLLQLRSRLDGAVLESEVLGKIEDRTGLPGAKDKPQPLRISISVKNGKLADGLEAEALDEIWPSPISATAGHWR